MMTPPRLVVAMASVGALALLCACSSYEDVPPSSTTNEMDAVPQDCGAIQGWSFVRDTLLPKCSGSTCHDSGNVHAVVVLAPSTAYQSTVRVSSQALPSMTLIEPGSPSRSFFFRKLSATQAAACQTAGAPATQCGGQMPLNDWFGLPEEWIEATRAWIACGAKP